MMKMIKQGIRLVVVLFMTLLIFSGCSKKVATIEGSSPSSKDIQTTVEVDSTAKSGGAEEVITEPIALLNPDIEEKMIEPSDLSEKSRSPGELLESDKSGESATNGDKAVSAGDLRDVFFDFDMTILKEGEMDILKKNAEWLKKNGSAVVRIEGHADERGTSEYNLALGEKRAYIIKKYLSVFGVPQKRIDTLSYGEEKSFCADHNEECWAKNRRGHFVVVEKKGSL